MPSVLDPANRIPLPSIRPPEEVGGAARVLPLVMQRQEQDNWCWSAVATSMAVYYDAASTWTQCELVNAELNLGACCEDGTSGQCNVPWYLDRVLRRVGRLRAVFGGREAWADLIREIDGQRPVCVRIGWNGGGGHFVAVSGYETVDETMDVRDPWYGDSAVSYDAFPGSYEVGGSWTHSYRTH